MKRLQVVISLLAAFFVAPRMVPAANVANFIDFSLRNASNQVLLPGRLYVPPQSLVPSSAPRPFMMYLHGSVANGTDNLAQVAEVKDRMLTEAMQRGAFLYAPQATSTWSTQTITDRVMTMIDRAINERHADAHRVYITGYSQGSNGTWTMLSRYEGRFAAAIPISGGNAAADFVGARLIDTPILALHTRDDASTSVTATRNNINSILAAAHEPLPTYLPGSNASTFLLSNPSIEIHRHFRELAHQQGSTTDFFNSNPNLDLMYYEPASGGHNGVVGAYHAPEIYDWLFAHNTATVPEPTTSVSLLLGGIALSATYRHRNRR